MFETLKNVFSRKPLPTDVFSTLAGSSASAVTITPYGFNYLFDGHNLCAAVVNDDGTVVDYPDVNHDFNPDGEHIQGSFMVHDSVEDLANFLVTI